MGCRRPRSAALIVAFATPSLRVSMQGGPIFLCVGRGAYGAVKALNLARKRRGHALKDGKVGLSRAAACRHPDRAKHGVLGPLVVAR